MMIDGNLAMASILEMSPDDNRSKEEFMAEYIAANGWTPYPNYPGYWADLDTEGRVVSTDELHTIYLQSDKPTNHV